MMKVGFKRSIAPIVLFAVALLTGCASQDLKQEQKTETKAMTAVHKAERKVEVAQKAVVVASAGLVAAKANLIKAKKDCAQKVLELKEIVNKK